MPMKYDGLLNVNRPIITTTKLAEKLFSSLLDSQISLFHRSVHDLGKKSPVETYRTSGSAKSRHRWESLSHNHCKRKLKMKETFYYQHISFFTNWTCKISNAACDPSLVEWNVLKDFLYEKVIFSTCQIPYWYISVMTASNFKQIWNQRHVLTVTIKIYSYFINTHEVFHKQSWK